MDRIGTGRELPAAERTPTPVKTLLLAVALALGHRGLGRRGPLADELVGPSVLLDLLDLRGDLDTAKKVLTSSMLNEDGTWNTFLRADYTRKK